MENSLKDRVVTEKELLIGVFEEMFGSGGFVGTAITNLENQIKNKKYSLVSNHHADNNSVSYFS